MDGINGEWYIKRVCLQWREWEQRGIHRGGGGGCEEGYIQRWRWGSDENGSSKGGR